MHRLSFKMAIRHLQHLRLHLMVPENQFLERSMPNIRQNIPDTA